MALVPADTICALATPPGKGSIGVIRVSGPDAFAIVDTIARRKAGRRCADYRGYSVHRAELVGEAGTRIDDVLITVFHGPRSYTGEDVVEICAHGGPIPLRLILSALYRSGARAAMPGEFTLRAFLNGKLDLAQAEAVADVIKADTEEAHRLAISQQAGRLSQSVEAIREIVLGVLARIEASIDFPEDVGELDVALCKTEITRAIAATKALLATAEAGIMYREGVSVVLVGRPNVGKSSLLNALLRTDRAIVTPISGTTRDVIEESANIRGIRVRFADTAGMRDSADIVEQIGVERSRTTASNADLALLILDASAGELPEDAALRVMLAGQRHLTVWNKCDLTAPPTGSAGIAVSAATGTGIADLENAIAQIVAGASPPVSDSAAVVTHSRHRTALSRALDRLTDALATIEKNLPADFISIDVSGALVAIGEITGETATDDIINEIFSRFCIGK